MQPQSEIFLQWEGINMFGAGMALRNDLLMHCEYAP